MKMKSNASKKFHSLHPDQHKMLSNLLNSAKQRKTCFALEENEDQINDELSNMMKNRNLMMFRDDDIVCENQRKSKAMLNKRISWSKNLIEVKLVLPWQNNQTENTDEI